MTTSINYDDIEERLRQAAEFMPEPTKPLPLSPVMEKRRQSGKRGASRKRRASLWHMPAWRVAVIVLLLFAAGSTTALAASPELRAAIAHFFTSGVTEEIPVDELESTDNEAIINPIPPDMETTDELSGSTAEQTVGKQTVGNLTFVQEVALDSHFTASYASSSDFLHLVKTPSGTPLLCTQTEEGETTYFSLAGGVPEEITLDTHTLTATVQPGILPGVMTHSGETAGYSSLVLPSMEFTINWQQYKSDILIGDSESTYRFDIGSTYGVDLGNDYDGRFSFRALNGQSETVEVRFNLDGQSTEYEYPFLLNLATGRVSDPLADVDLSDWACITELSISDDLSTATAMAGSSHDDLREITIDLATGTIVTSSKFAGEAPVGNCFTSFPIDDHTLFYVTGTEESGNGYLYDAQTGKSISLFTDAATYPMWGGDTSATRYWKAIGNGYLVYFADDLVSLINLRDGGTETMLEGIPMSRNVSFFMNNECTILKISIRADGPSRTERLCLLDLDTMEAWYFDRELPDGVKEKEGYWNSEYVYVKEAQNTETGTNYLYLYQYTP